MKAFKIWLWVIAAWILLSMLGGSLDFFTDYFWYQSENYQGVFWTLLKWKVISFGIMFLVTGMLLFLLSFPLLRYLKKYSLVGSQTDWLIAMIEKNLGIEIPKKMINVSNNKSKKIDLVYMILILVISFFSALAWKESYLAIAAFIKQVPFAINDPIFQNDISFYVFTLPILKPLWGLFGGMVFLVTIISTVVYLLSGEISTRTLVSDRVRKHFFFLLSMFAIWFAVRLWLSSYGLLYSSTGVVFGAGYSDIYGNLLALKASALLAGMLALFFMINIFVKFNLQIGTPVVVILVLIFLANTIYPALLQKFVVSPNEITKETPFIKHNIELTNYAYKLDQAKTVDFDYRKEYLDRRLLRDKDFINNIRIWDPSPLKQTYQQLQGIRLYYEFNDVDVDRYEIDGVKKGMALSARELANWKIPQRAKTWVNEKLKYTHGYGVVANHLSAVQPNGMPKFSIKDIPPKSDLLQVTRPEIYFGELTRGYVIVNTNTEEFDYPKGDENSYTTYQGKSGVVLDSFWKKVLFAMKFNDLKLLISNYIEPESRILYDRAIQQRVKKIMPLIDYDGDPYIVIRKDGSLVWMLDAYTTTSRFPYSEPYTRRMNYIRNSVKVVIDAYTGETSFYIADEEPLIETYSKIFENVFKPLSEMPEDIRKHIRYPEAFFYVQARMYQQYHIKDPGVFYNMEDLWNLPKETYSGKRIDVQPRYLFLKSGVDQEMKFVLAIPFTPNLKDNMTAYMYGDCDDMSLNVIQFSKDQLIYGPMQIEARIDQHPDISKELSLWSQKGSTVIRGNLLALPLEHNVLYVEPIYLQAEQSKMPELKRVVASMGDRLVMRSTLGEALNALFEGSAVTTAQGGQNLKEMIEDIYNIFIRTENAAGSASWKQFGAGMDELKGSLKNLKDRVSEQ